MKDVKSVFGGVVVLSAVTLIALPAQGGKPPPSPPDPCASASPSYTQNWAGFPAFAYVLNTRQTNRTPPSYEIRLASKNGVCSRRVGDSQAGNVGVTSFARNGDEYVLAWVWNNSAMLTRFDATDAEPAASAIPATFNLFRNSVGSLDFSPDGTHLAYSYQTGDIYPNRQIRVAALTDPAGFSDANLQTFPASESVSLWWAPWGRIYYNPMDAVNGKRIRALDPSLLSEQVPDTLLTVPAIEPLVVNRLFQIGQLSGGDLSGTQAVVFQGYYTTGVKMNGASGSWCVAAYAIDASAGHPFLIGSRTAPSSIVGFDISVTGDSTVLFAKSSAPTSGSSCNRTGYLGESGLTAGSTPSVVSEVPGLWPAALKQ